MQQLIQSSDNPSAKLTFMTEIDSNASEWELLVLT